MKIILRHDKNFNRFRPLNDKASTILALMKRRTFTPEQVDTLKANGFDLEIKYEGR